MDAWPNEWMENMHVGFQDTGWGKESMIYAIKYCTRQQPILRELSERDTVRGKDVKPERQYHKHIMISTFFPRTNRRKNQPVGWFHSKLHKHRLKPSNGQQRERDRENKNRNPERINLIFNYDNIERLQTKEKKKWRMMGGYFELLGKYNIYWEGRGVVVKLGG